MIEKSLPAFKKSMRIVLKLNKMLYEALANVYKTTKNGHINLNAIKGLSSIVLNSIHLNIPLTNNTLLK